MNKRILMVAFSALLFVGCVDDYKYDDEAPDFLGQSIYNELKSAGCYTNFVKLIDDLEYAEVLGRTGSKTLFVADDNAFAEFYKSNDWNVHSYDELSSAQKKLLLYSAMINNACLVEMMSSTQGNPPTKGNCLRRETSANVTDSVTYLLPNAMPISYNGDDKDYWARFRTQGGIRLVLDATAPMMTHFLNAQMQQKNITDKDFNIITGRSEDRSKEDYAYIFDCKIVDRDVVCQNGYINRLDKVLVAPQNMAEVLRSNGETNIFSHMIDRFSAPFYNEEISERYQALTGAATTDSVFEKRYFSKRSQSSAALSNDKGTDPVGNPTGNDVAYALNFDPGWNAFKSDDGSTTSKESDMGVIFAPTDETLYKYFFEEGTESEDKGKFLLDSYAPEEAKLVTGPADYENIYKAIDKIPLDVIEALINNLMKVSFNNSVPSKFTTVKNDAQDPMFTDQEIGQDVTQNLVKDTKLANNGIIYRMKKIIAPAKYASVSAPAYVSKNMRIFNYAINAEELDIQTNFYAYLLAMSSKFSFFVPEDYTAYMPSDSGLWYIDPISFARAETASDGPRIWKYEWDNDKKIPICTAYRYHYDHTTGIGSVGDKLTSDASVSNSEFKNRLRDMLETHTIVHAEQTDIYDFDESATGIECNRHYFLSKNGTPIYVPGNSSARTGTGMKVMGGWQVQHQNIADSDIETTKWDNKKNGYAYSINGPLQPTIESVYSTMYNTDEFQKFYELCQADALVLDSLGITQTKEIKKYNIFVNNNGLPAYDKQTGTQCGKATNVKFFNNFNYTVWVPTNDAIEEAINNYGLPTWDQLREMLFVEDEEGWAAEYGGLSDAEIQTKKAAIVEKGKTMVTLIINFVKNHFQDNAIFADEPTLKEHAYETATLQHDAAGNPTTYSKVKVSSEGSGTLYVEDEAGKKYSVTNDVNLITRDYELDSQSSPTQINSSSTAIMHGINGFLDFRKTSEGGGGSFKSIYSSAKARKAFMSKYSLLD